MLPNVLYNTHVMSSVLELMRGFSYVRELHTLKLPLPQSITTYKKVVIDAVAFFDQVVKSVSARCDEPAVKTHSHQLSVVRCTAQSWASSCWAPPRAGRVVLGGYINITATGLYRAWLGLRCVI
jgi:hypothetical protein